LTTENLKLALEMARREVDAEKESFSKLM